MKRFILAACAGLLAVAMALPSVAADLRRPAPVFKGPAFVAPVFTWTGFYVGINGGYGFGKSDWDPAPGSFSTNGGLVGGTLGYNLQTGSYVWGLEGDMAWSGMKGDNAGVETKVPWFATFRGRLGYAMDRFMPYVTGGLAAGQIRMDTGAGTDKETRYGWTLGAGVEWALLGNWSVKLEYLYADLGEASCGIAACVGTDVSFKTNIVRGGLNYRF